MTARWKLANRLFLWLTAFTAVPLLLSLVVGGLFLRYSVRQALEALVAEELSEATALLRGKTDPIQAFEAIRLGLAHQHADTPMAWRIFDSTGTERGCYGPAALLDDRAPAPGTGTEPTELGDGRLTADVVLPGGLVLGCVIDGRSHLAVVDRYWEVAAGVFVLGTFLALGASRLGAQRTAGLLRQVADAVTTEAGDATRSHGGTPPEEIRGVADALERSFDRLREETRHIQLLTASLAHELRSPVQNLIGQAELGLMEEGLPPRYRDLLANQLEELHELSDAVNNFLTLCTQDQPREGAREEFDLAEEIALRMARESHRIGRREVTTDVSVRGDTRIVGDREHVMRGLRNLIANAIDWSPDGGAVRVEVDGDADPVRIVVDDAGPGIDPAEHERVFEPFVRGASPRPGRVGYGLGLSIAKASVERQGGRISVGRSPAGGARFVVTLAREFPS